MTDLDTWYQHAARINGFIGGTLRTQRLKAFMTQQQQRAMVGILDGKYDQLWLRLQAIPCKSQHPVGGIRIAS